MNLHHGTLPAPRTLRYTVRQLGIRDELVFKSTVRILAPRTELLWAYEDSLRADLLVLGPHFAYAEDPGEPLLRRARHVLCVVPARQAQLENLALPLRSYEVLRHLDRMGQRILQQDVRERRATVPSAKAGPGVPDSSGPSEADCAVETRYELARWPSEACLRLAGDYARLATHMLAGPLSLRALIDRSGSSRAACRAFLERLVAEGSAHPMMLPAPTRQTGFPAGERTVRSPGSSKEDLGDLNAGNGLIARIRARFKLSPRVLSSTT